MNKKDLKLELLKRVVKKYDKIGRSGTNGDEFLNEWVKLLEEKNIPLTPELQDYYNKIKDDLKKEY